MSDTQGGSGGDRLINVLVVDDSAMMRAMIKRVISLAEMPIATVHEAANGEEALAILGAHPVDVMFTDINMPVMSGPELLRQMESHPDWSQVVRVVVSTDGSDARRAEMTDLKVRLYIEKPFRPEAMRDVLAEVAATASR
jgi:two-component system, chemotaxis family, chemotaxis protein CheY